MGSQTVHQHPVNDSLVDTLYVRLNSYYGQSANVLGTQIMQQKARLFIVFLQEQIFAVMMRCGLQNDDQYCTQVHIDHW